jgi:hypothetical protein
MRSSLQHSPRYSMALGNGQPPRQLTERSKSCYLAEKCSFDRKLFDRKFVWPKFHLATRNEIIHYQGETLESR